ncbi:MAG: hypothetical protein ACR2KE_02620 [Candidatus Nanopelagicales bacterium]
MLPNAQAQRDLETRIRRAAPSEVHVVFGGVADFPWPRDGESLERACLDACALLWSRPGAGTRLWVTAVPADPDGPAALVVEDDGAEVPESTWREHWVPRLESQSRALSIMGASVSAGSTEAGTSYVIAFSVPESTKPHPGHG